MKRRKIYYISILCLVFGFLLSCGSSKVNYTDEDISSLNELINSKSFEIESDWAYPLPSNALNSLANAGFFPLGNSANQINLIGNLNFLKISGDSIQAQLPYYGERRISADYNSRNTGITINGPLKDLKIDFDQKKQVYAYKFTAKNNTENFQIAINIFPNKQTYMSINSTHRTNIAYRGGIKAANENTN